MNSLIYGKPVDPNKTGLYAGVMTSGVAVSFVQFCAVQGQIPDVKAVLSNPQGTPIPHDSSGRWMVVAHLAEKVTEDTFGLMCDYINRMNLEFRLLFFRSVMIKNPELRSHPHFATAMGELSRYLNPTTQLV
jgi:hypothetical protein